MENSDLELNILSCLLQRPELMSDLILEDKHFKKYGRLWKFMRTYYEKYKNYDLVLMTSLCKDKFKLLYYLQEIKDAEPAPSRFKEYQQQLIMLYNEEKETKRKIERIYDLANRLYVREITLQDFKSKVNELIGGE